MWFDLLMMIGKPFAMGLGVLAGMVAVCLPAGASAMAASGERMTQMNETPSQLKTLSLEQLGEIQVTTVSKQPEEVWQTAAAISVLTADDIRRLGATTIPDLLRLVPGVDVARSQSGGWGVGIRGFNSAFSKEILVMIDGRSVYTPLFEGVYWDIQDLVLGDIERIEVIRGPGGTIWGPNAVNGVINIITKKAADTQGAMVHVSAGGDVDRFIGEVRYGFEPRPNLQMRLSAKGFNRGALWNNSGDPYDDWRQERGGFRVDYQPTKQDTLMMSTMVYGGRTGEQQTVTELTPLSTGTLDGQVLLSGGDVVLRWDRQLAHGSGLYVQGFFDRTNRTELQYSETRDTFDVDANYHIANVPHQDILLGGGLRESPSNFVQVVQTLNFTPNKFNNYVYSLFAQDAFHLFADKVTLTLGSKFDDNVYSGWGVQPSAQALWHARATTTAWGSVARALRTPGRLDRDESVYVLASSKGTPTFASLQGNPNFVPEVLIGWSAGVRQLLWKKLYVDVAAFHNQYDNVESYDAPTITVQTVPYKYLLETLMYSNGLRGVSDGVEVAPDWKPLEWFEMRGSFTHVHVALHSKVGYSQAAYASNVEGASPHREASVQGIFTLRHGLEIVPDYRFVSALPADKIPSYQTADFMVGWKVEKKLELSLTGRDLLAGRHEEFPGQNNRVTAVPREVFGGATWMW